ncbi:FtsK/SpoIIIE domain-containing protein [Microbacterium paludicola]|uniref:FtsK/SpoIIIE domain-containing protein n=1 Tax=Microbacterium paludicola TaxID=300019 RepID=UPI0031E3F8C5
MSLTASRPRAPKAQPLSVLPPRRIAGLGSVAVLLALAVVAHGVLLLIDEHTEWIVPIWICAGVLAAAMVSSAVRTFMRGSRIEPGIQAVMPMLGARVPSRDLVKVRRWTRGWVGNPQRVLIRYAADIDDDEERFVPRVVESFSRRMGLSYKVRRHNVRRCLLELELTTSEKKTKTHERAEKVVAALLGESASTKITLDSFGQLQRIDVKHNVGPRISQGARRSQIERTLSQMLPGRWRARWDLEADTVMFEIRPELPDMVRHEVDGPQEKQTHAVYKAFKIPIGVDEDGRTQCWQPSVSPHLLIAGGTGSGKTSLEHTILTHLANARWRIWVLDGKRIEFAGFRDWPNVELVASRIEDQVRMLHAAHELMEERYSLIEEGKATVADFEPLAVIIDEYATFKARVIRWYKTVKQKGDPTQPPVLDLLPDLARLARSAKIHLVLGLQRPDVEFVGGEMRDNFGARYSLGRLSPQGANMMWDSFAVGVAIPRNKQGRGVTLNAESLPVEAQAFYTPDPQKVGADDTEDLAHLARIREATIVTYTRKAIRPPEPVYDDEGEELAMPSYTEWVSAPIVDWTPSLTDELPDLPAAPASRRGLPSNVVPIPAKIRFEPSEPDVDDAEPATEADLFEGYGPALEEPIGQIGIGDLIVVDEDLEMWGVVESIEEDIVEDDYLCIDYRHFETGEPGGVSLPDSAAVTVRRPTGD